MKNLRITSFCLFGRGVIEKIKGAERMCIGSQNEVYFLKSNGLLIAFDKNQTELQRIELPLMDDNFVEAIEFLYDDQDLCLIYKKGQIFTVNNITGIVELVFDLMKPIHGCAWSPDQNLLVIASDNHLFMISRDFKIVTEAALRPTSSGKDQLLTIGWGSIETQFQGSLGKHNRERPDLNKLPIPLRDQFDDRKVLISWRHDGSFFTVSSVDEIPQPKPSDLSSKNVSNSNKIFCRQCRIWNRELDFMSQCEFLAGIESGLSVRPVGNLIAVPRINSDERHIYLFERNGQQRDKFKMLCKTTEDLSANTAVLYLRWNMIGNILLIYFFNKTDNSYQLQFWTVSNYSWTEKLRLSIGRLADLFWDIESPLKVHYLTSEGEYCQLNIHFEYNCEDMISLSLDGDKMRVTDLKYAAIPPPMCHWKLDLSFTGVPSSFAFSSRCGLAVLSSDFHRLLIFRVENRKFMPYKSVQINANEHLLFNLTWLNMESVLALRKVDDGTQIIEIKINSGEIFVLHQTKCNFSETLVFHKPINWVANPNSALKHDCHELENKEGKLLLMDHGLNDYYYSKIIEHERHNFVFTLNNKHIFHVNGKFLHSDISCFYCTTDYLSVITLDSKLYCIMIKDILSFFENPSVNLFTRVRNVERGSQLVATEPNGTRIWLQMPRGNLELIHHMTLLMEKLKKYLDAKDWSNAYFMMRTHKINMNLLFDHNPRVFTEDIGNFIDQIGDVDHLIAFLSSLDPMNIKSREYSHYYSDTSFNANWVEGKVNTICERIRNHLLNISDEARQLKFYSAVLTSFIVETPKKISAALINMRSQLEKNGNSDSARKWLRHMAYFVGESNLFKQALKTYNLEIALVVAQTVNKDPKEYLPILKALQQKQPPLYQRYHIDLFLEEWKSALEHIAQLVLAEEGKSPYFEECLNHVRTHNLHFQALKHFCGRNNYKEICKIAAEAAEKQSLFREAAQLFEKAGDIGAAMNCLLLAQDFKEYMRLAQASECPAEKSRSDLKKMVIQLMNKSEFATAAEVYSFLGKEENLDNILDCFSKSNAWRNFAVFISGFNETNNDDVINRAKVILSTRCTEIIEHIDGWRDIVSKLCKRLELLRKEKDEKIRQISSGKDAEFGEEWDMRSESSSTASFMSVRSKFSSLTHRRHRLLLQKKQKIKEGSHWEDAAILIELKNVYVQIDKQQDELVELLPALFSLDLVEKGIRLQNEMLELLEFVFSNRNKIWPAQLEPKHLPGPIVTIYEREADILDGRTLTLTLPTTTHPMPVKIWLDDELIPPKLRTHVQWKLNIYQ